jgi:ABC-type branched-subunit amino acid transport system ATPase component
MTVAPDVLLQVDGLIAGYDGSTVIRDLSFCVGPGEVVAMLGANGAGKTTTLRAITNLIRRTSGTVRLRGRDVSALSTQHLTQQGVSHVPEGRGIFAGLTVAEHFRLEKASPDEAYEYFPALRELRNRRAGLLSGGEQQMLALAAALVRKPSLLLIDELSLGLARSSSNVSCPSSVVTPPRPAPVSSSSNSTSNWRWRPQIGESSSPTAPSSSNVPPPSSWPTGRCSRPRISVRRRAGSTSTRSPAQPAGPQPAANQAPSPTEGPNNASLLVPRAKRQRPRR